MHPVHLHSLRLHCSIHTQVTMRWTHYHFGLAGLLCTSPPGYLVYSYVSVSFKNNINSHLFFQVTPIYWTTCSSDIFMCMSTDISKSVSKPEQMNFPFNMLLLRVNGTTTAKYSEQTTGKHNNQPDLHILQSFPKLTSLLSILKLDSHALQNLWSKPLFISFKKF